MASNQETAQLLKKVAAVFRVREGDTFRYKAYQNAATAIENSAESIYELWQQGKLDNVPGIGVNLQKYLSEYFKRGQSRHFESLFKKVPQGMFALLNIRGVGPITAYKIAKKFKLNNPKTAIRDLQKIIKEGKLTEIASFKEKTVTRIHKAIEFQSETKTKRLLQNDAFLIAQDFVNFIKSSKSVSEIEMLGSLRRKVATVGDIDLAIAAKNIGSALDYALSYPKIKTVITKGDKLAHVKLKNGYEVDIKMSEIDEWGSLLQHYTGSKMHNIKLRTLALNKGVSLSEYGIKKGTATKKFKSEKDFYQYLGLSFIPPEMREDKGEIELAQKKRVPKLIEITNIKGDLHIHSDFDFPTSHDIGDSSLTEILTKTTELGYEYIGISDHNPKFIGLTEKQKKNYLEKRTKYLMGAHHAYEKTVKKRVPNLLIGMEVDIRPDGDLALSDTLMNLLDYAIVSIHSSFDQSLEKNTQRILEALSHPKAIILGHPTGRMLNSREPISADWEKIFKFCYQQNKIVEVNSSPQRLDLPDDLIRLAISHKVKLIINTDSHHLDNLDFMPYGVWQCKRGWASSKDVINTYSYRDLRAVLKLN